MSVKQKSLLAVMLLGAAGLVAADDELPDMEFLEYLGSWDESDEDWVLFADDGDDQEGPEDEPRQPAPQGEKVAELEDED